MCKFCHDPKKSDSYSVAPNESRILNINFRNTEVSYKNIEVNSLACKIKNCYSHTQRASRYLHFVFSLEAMATGKNKKNALVLFLDEKFDDKALDYKANSILKYNGLAGCENFFHIFIYEKTSCGIANSSRNSMEESLFKNNIKEFKRLIKLRADKINLKVDFESEKKYKIDIANTMCVKVYADKNRSPLSLTT